MVNVKVDAAETTAQTLGLGGDYVESWDDFIGQEAAKTMLQVSCQSANIRQAPLPHILLQSGKPGIGKTTLALCVAKEMGTEAKIVSGKIDSNHARILLSDMSDRDILIIDEIHLMVSGGKASAEWLLHYLQDGVIMGPLGKEEQPKVTVIGCTTDPGRLPATILTRFTVRPVLTAYTVDEAAWIAQGKAERQMVPYGLPLPSEENLQSIANAANCNPRIIGQIVASLRDLSLVHLNMQEDGNYDVARALEFLGLTEDGLDPTCRNYLRILLKDFAGGAGERALQDRLQEPGGLGLTEMVLMEKGLIAKTKSGRVLTKDGIRRAQQLQREMEAS